MGERLWEMLLATGRDCSPYVPGPAVSAQLYILHSPGSLGRALYALLLSLFCGHVSLLERADRRGAAGRGEVVGTAPPADSHHAPLAPTRPTGI